MNKTCDLKIDQQIEKYYDFQTCTKFSQTKGYRTLQKVTDINKSRRKM